MIKLEDIKKELKNKLKEICNISLNQEEAISVENISFALLRIVSLANEIIDKINKLPKNIQQFIDLKIIEEMKNYCEKINSIAENCIRKVDDVFISEKTKEEFVEHLEIIYGISRKYEKVCFELRDMLTEKSRNFAGRKSELLEKLSNIFDNIENNYKEIKKESNNLMKGLRNKRPLTVSPEILNLLRSLKLGRGTKGIWAHEIVEKISGLRSVAGEPYIEEVSVEAPFIHEEAAHLTVDQLFHRYPPFEPIQVEYNGIIGRFIWFLKSTNVIFEKPKNIRIDECAEVDEETSRLNFVKPFDILNDVQNGEIKIKIHAGSRNIVSIKYGSRKLYSYVQIHGHGTSIRNLIDKIQNRYEMDVQGKKKTERAYSVSNLGYVWYCILGLGMSTDPYDFDCPFMQKCFVSGKSGRKCDKWSWSRRLFPKVYVVPERELILTSAANLKRGSPLLFIKPFAATSVRIHELYKRAQWYMPSVTFEGPIVEIKFEKEIIKDLPRTNILGFEIPISLVKAIIESLLDEKIPGKPEVTMMYNGHNYYNISLDKLLISKFFVYMTTKEGLDTFSFFRTKDDKLIKRIHQKLQKGLDQDKVINFAISVLGHTLAHLLHSYVSNVLEIDPENLLYVYNIDKKEGILMVAIAENSAWGSLDIVSHAEAKFGSIDKMIEGFIDFIVKSLEDHEKDIQTYMMKMQKIVVDSKVKEIANELKNRYTNLVSNGIVLDTTAFINHIVISEQDNVIAKKLQLNNVRELRERLTDAVVVAGISVCIDGCPACVMLDHGCTAPLIQNIVLSRNLAAWILKVLTGREPIKGRGNVLGSAIFYQAKESFFAFSPYLDEEGVKILTDLAQKGVKVTLVTRRKFAEKFGEQLKKHGIEVYVMKAPRHDKFYILDGRVRVRTTQNLSNLSSINEFLLEQLEPEEAESIVRRELEGGAVERYGGG